MVDLTDLPRLGPYVLTRDLERCDLAERCLALHDVEQTSHLLYRFPTCRDKASQRRFLDAVEQIARVDHAHVLPIEQFAFDIAYRPWLVTPFPGAAGDVLTLARHVREKGGQLSPDEAERAVTQLLEAVESAHAVGVRHGPIGLGDVLIDRRGSLLVELYGLDRAMRGMGPGDAELARDEVRSVVEIGYQLITGLRAEAPLIPADRLVKKLDAHWARWLAHGLDPAGGFETVVEAIAALPSRRRVVEVKPSGVGMRAVLGRFRTVR
ncbi:MAG: hypothetical protein KF745_02965 [Phycisphaeraceae bacterium]|nr:hypothetical protein [Phycisphaeraceae bacterium]